jgi:hypothetical protein
MQTVTQFEVGKTYIMSWIGDSNLKTNFRILTRTAQTVTILKEHSKPQTCRIAICSDKETVSPEGRYSMSPVLFADRVLITKAEGREVNHV